MRVTLSGITGSGKTTIGKLLAENYNVPFISAGKIARREANKRGLTIEQFQTQLTEQSNFDKFLDDKLIEWAKSKNEFVMDYRLGYKFIPNAIDIFLKVSFKNASQRVKNQERASENTDQNLLKLKKSLENRESAVRKRLLKIYKTDYLDQSNYDVVIDTNGLTKDEVLAKVMENMNK